MSLDVTLTAMRPVVVFDGNITHNLNAMAKQAGIYEALWRPEELPITKAGDLVPRLQKGLAFLRDNPEVCKQHNPENGWGTYEGLVSFVEKYLKACEANADADIKAWR